MISFRYHLLSVIAIFLALALGVVVGATALRGALVGDLRRQVSDLKAANRAQAARIDAIKGSADDADKIAQTYGGKLVAGALANTGVVVLAAPSATPALLSAVTTEITAAGGSVSASLQLTAAFSDPTRAADIQSLVTSPASRPIGLTQVPATADPGTLAGALLGYVLFGHGAQSDLPTVLASFASLKMITYSGTPAPGKAVLLVAPGVKPAGDPATSMLSSMATELASSLGGPTVVAGDTSSASNGGLIATLRANSGAKQVLSTADDVDTPVGQLTAVLTIADTVAGRKGDYGTAAGADALTPGASS